MERLVMGNGFYDSNKSEYLYQSRRERIYLLQRNKFWMLLNKLEHRIENLKPKTTITNGHHIAGTQFRIDSRWENRSLDEISNIGIVVLSHSLSSQCNLWPTWSRTHIKWRDSHECVYLCAAAHVLKFNFIVLFFLLRNKINRKSCRRTSTQISQMPHARL